MFRGDSCRRSGRESFVPEEPMSQEVLVERFFETLISGNRPAARAIVQETIDQNVTPEVLISSLLWPAHELIERLHRSDQMTAMSYHLSTRLLRTLVDQAAARLDMTANNGKTVFAVCGSAQSEELAAQMAVDILESHGFRVSFAGGGMPGDEILAQVHENRPNVLLMFASAAPDLPEIRSVIDRMREINACPNTQIVVGGGVFNRAEGLAEEIGADLWASDPLDLVELLESQPMARANLAQRVAAKKRPTKSRSTLKTLKPTAETELKAKAA